MNDSRRGFLTGLAGAVICAPAVIRTPGLLMPIKPVRISSVISWELWKIISWSLNEDGTVSTMIERGYHDGLLRDRHKVGSWGVLGQPGDEVPILRYP